MSTLATCPYSVYANRKDFIGTNTGSGYFDVEASHDIPGRMNSMRYQNKLSGPIKRSSPMFFMLIILTKTPIYQLTLRVYAHHPIRYNKFRKLKRS